jgi:hypothetical protein
VCRTYAQRASSAAAEGSPLERRVRSAVAVDQRAPEVTTERVQQAEAVPRDGMTRQKGETECRAEPAVASEREPRTVEVAASMDMNCMALRLSEGLGVTVMASDTT